MPDKCITSGINLYKLNKECFSLNTSVYAPHINQYNSVTRYGQDLGSSSAMSGGSSPLSPKSQSQQAFIALDSMRQMPPRIENLDTQVTPGWLLANCLLPPTFWLPPWTGPRYPRKVSEGIPPFSGRYPYRLLLSQVLMENKVLNLYSLTKPWILGVCQGLSLMVFLRLPWLEQNTHFETARLRFHWLWESFGTNSASVSICWSLIVCELVVIWLTFFFIRGWLEKADF